MTSQEFVIWLKGFTEGVHEFNITPKQWDILKDKLAEVDQPIRTSGYIAPFTFSSGSSGTFSVGGVPNATITYTTNGTPNWYSTAIPEDKTLLND